MRGATSSTPPRGGACLWTLLVIIGTASRCGRTDLEMFPESVDAGGCEDVQSAVTTIFRSVGPANGSALAQGQTSGGGETSLVVADSVARFSGGLPRNVGVGDVLEYDADGDGAVDGIAFVHCRISALALAVRGAAGAASAPTAGGTTTWSIFRAYTSLAEAVLGQENPAIWVGARNFDSWSGGKDLCASRERWRLACYADAADTVSVLVAGPPDGWVTCPEYRLEIFTPVGANEVGTSQRHHGTWDDHAYRLVVADDGLHYALRNETAYLEVDGLQVSSIATAGVGVDGVVSYVSAAATAGGSNVEIAHNIIHADLGASPRAGAGIDAGPNGAASVTRISNNVVYDFNEGSGVGIRACDGSVFAYDNTVVGCAAGLEACSLSSLSVALKNNLVAHSASDASFVDYRFFDAVNLVSAHNLSSDSSSPDPDFAMATTSFRDVASRNFHLAATDTAAIASGVDLRDDPALPVNDDIDGETRGTMSDIGADQVTAARPSSIN